LNISYFIVNVYLIILKARLKPLIYPGQFSMIEDASH